MRYSKMILAGVSLLLVSVGILLAEEAPVQAVKSWGLYIGAALAIGLPAVATGFAQAKIGAAGAGAMAEKPALFGPILALIAIPETAVILGFVVAILMIF